MFWFIMGVENIGWPLLFPLLVLFELFGGGGCCCCGGSDCCYEVWLGYDEVELDATDD